MILSRRNLFLLFIILAVLAGTIFVKAGYVLTLHGGVTFDYGFPLKIWGIHYDQGTRCIVPFEEPGMFHPLLPLPWQYILCFGVNILLSAAIFFLLTGDPAFPLIKKAAWILTLYLLFLLCLNISFDWKYGIYQAVKLNMLCVYACIFILSLFTLIRKGRSHAD